MSPEYIMLLNLKMNQIHKKSNKLINKNNNKTEFHHLESKNNNNNKTEFHHLELKNNNNNKNKNPVHNSIVNTLEK